MFAGCPFTSGHIHVGHVRSYTIGDAYARYRRMRGDAVLFSIGFDAFGLPAELAAIARGSAADWVQRSYEHMLGQFERMGFSFDWERVFVSSDAEQYRWSQWLFLALEERMLYQEEANVDWCDSCQTRWRRCRSRTASAGAAAARCALIRRTQWFLRITSYLEENERGIDAATSGTSRRSSPSARSSAVSTASRPTCTAPTAATHVSSPSIPTRSARRVRDGLAAHPELESWVTDARRSSSSRRSARAAGSAATARRVRADAGTGLTVAGGERRCCRSSSRPRSTAATDRPPCWAFPRPTRATA